MNAGLLVPISMACLCLASCGAGEAPPPAETGAAVAEDESPEVEPVLVVFLGDSLTAGFGLEEEQAHPALVAKDLRTGGLAVRVVNAGVSGDTSAGGLSRLDWLLRQQPDILVVSLGANDGLRGLPLENSQDNLRQIVTRAREAGVQVLLTGMKMPPNYGEYADDFEAMFPRVASELGVPLVPFLLAGVAGRPELNLADGIHPNVAGQRLLADTVTEYLKPLVAERGKHLASEDSPGE